MIDDCLNDKREDYLNCSVLFCVLHLCAVISTDSYEQILQVNHGLLAQVCACVFLVPGISLS